MAYNSHNSALSSEHQRLMELVEVEDAANGEVGWGSKLPVYLQTCHINISDAAFRDLLREHLGHRLMEVKLDRIVKQVQAFVEPVVVNAHIQGSVVAVPSIPTDTVTELIPSKELYHRFKTDLGEVCSDADLKQLVAFTHQVIHRAVQQNSISA